MDASAYVELRNGGYYVKGVRVSLDSIVYSFRNGDSPETIQRNFPALTLAQIYGAITFYLENEAAVDASIREGEVEMRRTVPHLSQTKPELFSRLQRARHNFVAPDTAGL